MDTYRGFKIEISLSGEDAWFASIGPYKFSGGYDEPGLDFTVKSFIDENFVKEEFINGYIVKQLKEHIFVFRNSVYLGYLPLDYVDFLKQGIIYRNYEIRGTGKKLIVIPENSSEEQTYKLLPFPDEWNRTQRGTSSYMINNFSYEYPTNRICDFIKGCTPQSAISNAKMYINELQSIENILLGRRVLAIPQFICSLDGSEKIRWIPYIYNLKGEVICIPYKSEINSKEEAINHAKSFIISGENHDEFVVAVENQNDAHHKSAIGEDSFVPFLRFGNKTKRYRKYSSYSKIQAINDTIEFIFSENEFLKYGNDLQQYQFYKELHIKEVKREIFWIKDYEKWKNQKVIYEQDNKVENKYASDGEITKYASEGEITKDSSDREKTNVLNANKSEKATMVDVEKRTSNAKKILYEIISVAFWAIFALGILVLLTIILQIPKSFYKVYNGSVGAVIFAIVITLGLFTFLPAKLALKFRRLKNGKPNKGKKKEMIKNLDNGNSVFESEIIENIGSQEPEPKIQQESKYKDKVDFNVIINKFAELVNNTKPDLAKDVENSISKVTGNNEKFESENSDGIEQNHTDESKQEIDLSKDTNNTTLSWIERKGNGGVYIKLQNGFFNPWIQGALINMFLISKGHKEQIEISIEGCEIGWIYEDSCSSVRISWGFSSQKQYIFISAGFSETTEDMRKSEAIAKIISEYLHSGFRPDEDIMRELKAKAAPVRYETRKEFSGYHDEDDIITWIYNSKDEVIGIIMQRDYAVEPKIWSLIDYLIEN